MVSSASSTGSAAVHIIIDVVGYYDDHVHTATDIVDESLTGADIEDGSVTGDDVANNTLSNLKTSNEAGIANGFNTTPTTLTNSVQRIGSTSIRVPSNGYLHISASGIFNAGAAGTDMAWCQITKGATRTSLNILATNPEPWTSLSDFGAWER